MLRFLIPAIVLAAVYYTWRYPEGLAGLAKLIRPLAFLGLALLYARSPIDVLPGFFDELAAVLAALYFGRPPRGDVPEENAADVDDADPYRVLGVARGASPVEITAAFRDKMKQYHPDRVAGLGEELQKMAHDKSIEIRRAYDLLKEK